MKTMSKEFIHGKEGASENCLSGATSARHLEQENEAYCNEAGLQKPSLEISRVDGITLPALAGDELEQASTTDGGSEVEEYSSRSRGASTIPCWADEMLAEVRTSGALESA